MTDVIYWAQDLQNSAPDVIVRGDNTLAADDASSREEALALVGHVVEKGRPIYRDEGVRLVTHGGWLVLQVASDKRDDLGRMAPIVCCRNYGAQYTPEIGQTVIEGLQQFAGSIERSICAEHVVKAEEALKQLEKKK